MTFKQPGIVRVVFLCGVEMCLFGLGFLKGRAQQADDAGDAVAAFGFAFPG